MSPPDVSGPRILRHDDTLFLAGGSNDVLRLYSEDGFAELVDVSAWKIRLAAREAFFHDRKIPWCQLLVPEKLSVGGDALLPHGSRPPAARFRAAMRSPRLVDPTAAMRARGSACYARTDSHWLPEGAAVGFGAAMAALRMPAIPFDLPLCETYFHGDLWSAEHADLPQEKFARLAVPDSITRIYANPIVALKAQRGLENEAGLHIGSHVVWRNDRAPLAQRLLLFGSSFSEYRLACSLLSLQAALTFAEVHFVWSSDLDLGLIDRITPDLALLELPERFLTHCPRDDFDLIAQEALSLSRYEGLPGPPSASSSS